MTEDMDMEIEIDDCDIEDFYLIFGMGVEATGLCYRRICKHLGESSIKYRKISYKCQDIHGMVNPKRTIIVLTDGWQKNEWIGRSKNNTLLNHYMKTVRWMYY